MDRTADGFTGKELGIASRFLNEPLDMYALHLFQQLHPCYISLLFGSRRSPDPQDFMSFQNAGKGVDS